MKRIGICVAAAILLALAPLTASAHILAMVNYESKTEEGLHAHGIKDHGDRKEGIAVIDVDPESKTFGEIVVNISLPPNLVGHHIFYNRDMSKLDLPRFSGELFTHSRSAISNWTGLL